MPGVELSDAPFTVPSYDRSLWRTHKQLPRTRDYVAPPQHLSNGHDVMIPRADERGVPRETHLSSKSRESLSNIPSLPLTPPSAPREESQAGEDDASDHENRPAANWGAHRSGLSTPTNQRSPPTPDITPPRMGYLLSPDLDPRVQTSISSRADSFKTAKEDMSSDEEVGRSESPWQRPSRHEWLHTVQISSYNHTLSSSEFQSGSADATPTEPYPRSIAEHAGFSSFDAHGESERRLISSVHVSAQSEQAHTQVSGSDQNVTSGSPQEQSAKQTGDADLDNAWPRQHRTLPRRQRSLRERVHESRHIAATSTDNLEHTSEWSSSADRPEVMDKVDGWRLSGISTTSTIEAIVIDTPPQRKRTLRHTEKHASLRSVSSPIPRSNRSSWNSNPGSQRRLVRKHGTITNGNRWSMNSNMSVATSITSSPVKQMPEQIPVVVIPQRRSSLKSSNSSSRRQSASLSQSSGSRRPTTAPNGGTGYFDISRRKERNRSDSAPSGAALKTSNGPGRAFPPIVPPRSSSLSAPTSRNQSRAASLTSESARSNNLVPEPLQTSPCKISSVVPSAYQHADSAFSHESVTNEWAPFRPPSAHLTPFSQPSVQSSSPGAIEISEARAINLYPHNNRSLLVVEKATQVEPSGVQGQSSVQQPHLHRKPSTPIEVMQPAIFAESPLKNPREPPIPPAFKVIPPTPAAVTPTEEADKQLGRRPSTSDGRSRISRRLGSMRRALSARRYSDSWGRSLNLKTNARNKKADQELDNRLHPFWRPRGFWDDFSESDSEGEYPDEDIIVNNSLGMPQKRIIFDGPLSLVRRISGTQSKPRSHNRNLHVKTSYGSIPKSRIRSIRSVHALPALRLQFQVAGLRDMQVKIQRMKQRRDEEKREKRRQELRQSIGHNVIAQGDSRYV